MGTPFNNIFEIFRMMTESYKLDIVLKEDEEVFYEILKNFLIIGLPEFKDCLQSLEYEAVEEVVDEETVTRYYFIETLDDDVEMIISKIMTARWFRRNVQDLTSLQDSLSKREFAKFSMAESLKQKSAYLNDMISEYKADIKNYNFEHLDELEGWS